MDRVRTTSASAWTLNRVDLAFKLTGTWEPLLITPATGFTAMGCVGGRFTVMNETFSLTNSGTNSLTWSLANTSSWLNASPSGGILTSGGSAATVVVSLNSTASSLLVGTYTATVWFSNLYDSFVQSRQFTLAVGPPVITSGPADQAVSVGDSATFCVSATGPTPLSYSWRRDGMPIAGANTSCYTTNNVQPADSGSQFSCLVSNGCGTRQRVPTLCLPFCCPIWPHLAWLRLANGSSGSVSIGGVRGGQPGIGERVGFLV